ncbi:MAG TPA: hypothetical protein VGF13_07735 [Verrucomicrobiae bacterium]|jgi:hypothetical protein
MTETQKSILESLLELESAVASMPQANPKPNLLPLFSRLDELTQALPTTTDPTLLHYLHKKSYQKARLYLEGCDAENARGNCHGHVDEHGRAWSPQRAANVPLAKESGETPPAR